jgi:hypothetical protein
MANRNDVDKLKSQGKYREAGALAYSINPNDRDYGCHFGMRSERSAAIAAFDEGFDGAKFDAYKSEASKKDFMAHVRAIYRAANLADSDSPDRATWMHPKMAGEAGCAALDTMLHEMVKCGVLTHEELQHFHDTL